MQCKMQFELYMAVLSAYVITEARLFSLLNAVSPLRLTEIWSRVWPDDDGGRFSGFSMLRNILL